MRVCVRVSVRSRACVRACVRASLGVCASPSPCCLAGLAGLADKRRLRNAIVVGPFQLAPACWNSPPASRPDLGRADLAPLVVMGRTSERAPPTSRPDEADNLIEPPDLRARFFPKLKALSKGRPGPELVGGPGRGPKDIRALRVACAPGRPANGAKVGELAGPLQLAFALSNPVTHMLAAGPIFCAHTFEPARPVSQLAS